MLQVQQQLLGSMSAEVAHFSILLPTMAFKTSLLLTESQVITEMDFPLYVLVSKCFTSDRILERLLSSSELVDKFQESQISSKVQAKQTCQMHRYTEELCVTAEGS